jgi:hypothetical protein
MTANHYGPALQHSELPCHVQTALGPGVITLVAVALGRASVSHGDRIILRLAVEGQSDVYAVFERDGAPSAPWSRASNDLSSSELADWPDHRPASGESSGDPFSTWLDALAGWLSTRSPAGEGSGASE